MSANSQQLFKLNGRIALVTGSTRCIGLAASRALAYQGAIVVINGRNADTVAAVVEMGKGENLDFRAMPFDVGDTAASMAALHQIGCYVGLGPRQITALGIVRSFQRFCRIGQLSPSAYAARLSNKFPITPCSIQKECAFPSM